MLHNLSHGFLCCGFSSDNALLDFAGEAEPSFGDLADDRIIFSGDPR